MALDLDGTLLDCRNRQCMLARSLASAVGLDLDLDAFWRLKRSGAPTQAAFVRLGVKESAAAKLAFRWVNDIEGEYWLQYDAVFDDVSSALDVARSEGWRIEVLTARQRPDSVLRQLTRLDLSLAVDRINIVSLASVAEQKADVLRAIGASALIGDSESDYRAASLSGVTFLAVATGQRSPSFLHSCGDFPVFDNLQAAIRSAIITSKGRAYEQHERDLSS